MFINARLSILSIPLSSKFIIVNFGRSTNVWVWIVLIMLNEKFTSSRYECISPWIHFYRSIGKRDINNFDRTDSKLIEREIKLKKKKKVPHNTWKVPFLILSISLSCNSIRLILFRKWKDVSGSDLILLLLKSKCCRFVRNLNGAFGISETEGDRAWDILNVRSEWPTWGNSKIKNETD